jgi:hypothetical protein
MAFTPEESPNLKAARDAENRVKDSPRGNFIFAYHPDEWVLDHRGRLVPTIVHLSKEPGDGGVGADGDFMPAELQYRKRGWQLIPHDILGKQDYVALYRNVRGKRVHRTIFQEGYNTAAGTTEWAFDEDGWVMFLGLLRKKGLIKQPRPKVVAGLLRTQQELLEDKLKREPNTDSGVKHERWEKAVQTIRDGIRTLERELEKSYEVYGRPQSIGRSSVQDLLEQLEEEEGASDPETAAILQRTRAQRAAAQESDDVDEDLEEQGDGGIDSTPPADTDTDTDTELEKPRRARRRKPTEEVTS